MSDTQRTKADLAGLMAGTTPGAITAQVVRDFLESCVPSGAFMHFVDPGTPTTIGAPATFVKAGNTTQMMAGSYRFSMPVNNRLQYDGDVAVHALVTATLSVSAAVNNQVVGFAIALNGTVDTPSIMKAKVATGGDLQTVTLQSHLIISPGDYVEVFVDNDTSASNVTVQHGNVHVIAFLI